MAIGLISILEILFVVISLFCIYALIAKDGKYVNKFSKFVVVSSIILLGLIINFTSLPSNYATYRLIELVLMIITLLSVALYHNEFKVSRIILSIVGFLSLIMFF